MTDFVVDASVAVKWFVPEADSEAALKLLASVGQLYAPSLLALELANAIRKNVSLGRVDRSVWREASAQIPRFVQLCDTSAAQLDVAFGLAVDFGHPLYDCIYLALAMERGCQLVTADAKFMSRISGTVHAHRIMLLGQFR